MYLYLSNIKRWLNAIAVAALLLPLTNFLITPNQAKALDGDCDGTITTEYDCQITDLGSPLTGTYRTVLGGDGTFEDNTSGAFNLTVPACSAGPATIVQATLSWALRDTDETFWEDGVDISVDAGPPTTVTPDRRYKGVITFAAAPLAYTNYLSDITGLVVPGTANYALTGMDTTDPGGTVPLTSQWGYGIHVVYSCPEFPLVTVQQKEGLDMHWHSWSEPYAVDRSDLICQSFTADTVARTMTLDAFLPGAADANREADLWYKTGTGVAPSPTDYDLLTDVNTPANGGAVLQRLVLVSDDPEWDSYQNTTITIPAGHEYICVQSDSSFSTTEHPDNAAVNGASMFFGASWFTLPEPIVAPTTYCIGNFVWYDENEDGVQDGGETGASGVVATVYASGGSVVGTDTTDGSGAWQVCSLSDGDYYVVFSNVPSGYEFTVDTGGTESTDSDPDQSSGQTANFTISGADNYTVDAGLIAVAVTEETLEETGSSAMILALMGLGTMATAMKLFTVRATTIYKRH